MCVNFQIHYSEIYVQWCTDLVQYIGRRKFFYFIEMVKLDPFYFVFSADLSKHRLYLFKLLGVS